MSKSLEAALKHHVDGEVHFDEIHRRVYSVDASIYEVEPIGVVLPRSRQALVTTVKLAYEHGVPVIARGAATGITGGCLGQGLVIDTSKYLNRIIEIGEDYAICEPGVVQDQLNAALAPRNLRLGPDTSTGNRATLGGMLANNSAGAHSLLYGTMADHIKKVELVLSNGESINFSEVDAATWHAKCLQADTEGYLYREFRRLKEIYQEEIEQQFPHIPRCVSGYNLSALLTPDLFNPCRLIAGSEGTLGIATKIKVKTTKKHGHTGLCIVHFSEMEQAMQSIEPMLQWNPISLEMIDDKILEAGCRAPSLRNQMEWLQGHPKTIFVVELEGTPEEVRSKLEQFTLNMQQKAIGYAYTQMTEPQKKAQVWDVRKAGLGLLLSKRTYSRAIAFIEDISIHPNYLPAFMKEFCHYLSSVGKEAGIYGHVGAGCMHIRPYIDMRQQSERDLMKRIMRDVSDLVLKYKGAMSGEHGDGLVRSWLNKKMFGDRLYQAFVELKNAFDPKNGMNPGKIVEGPPFLSSLRQAPTEPIETFLDFTSEGGFDLAVDMCNGNGLCRKSEKIMCPSFQVSNDEFLTTRARAQALHTALLTNRKEALASHDLYDVLDLCLECKGCKTECPSEVDMAKMKAEFLYQYQKAHGTSLRSWLFANIGQFNTIAAPIAPIANFLTNNVIGQTVLSWLGITPERMLPNLAKERFTHWYKKQNFNKKREQVVLYSDTFNEFYQPEIGQSAVKILNALGYEVIVPPWKCCGRVAFSKGLLSKAQKMATDVITMLASFAKKNLPIIGLEPSCLLMIKDDYQGLIPHNDSLKKVIAASTTFDEFLNQHLDRFPLLSFVKHTSPVKVNLHGHCHQKALIGMEPTLNVLRTVPGFDVTEIPSGCCGLAGSFGYEKEHYEISMKIGELKLFPAVRAAATDSLIVADGFSCRSQITHGTNRHAYHLAEALAKAQQEV